MKFLGIKYILFDIEGTTSSLDFVHKTLFPYAMDNLEPFIAEHAGNTAVAELLNSLTDTHATELSQCAGSELELLKKWIREDRKEPVLKNLQGILWERGYELGDYRAHVYEEVPGELKRFKSDGMRLGIYSSGSIKAQKLLFTYTEYGDLTPYFENYFDTSIGSKKEVSSYERISKELAKDSPKESPKESSSGMFRNMSKDVSLKPAEILFVSDSEIELDSASKAGLKVVQTLREGVTLSAAHPKIQDFSEIEY